MVHSIVVLALNMSEPEPTFDFHSLMLGSVIMVALHNINSGLGWTPNFDQETQLIGGLAAAGIAVLMALHRFGESR